MGWGTGNEGKDKAIIYLRVPYTEKCEAFMKWKIYRRNEGRFGAAKQYFGNRVVMEIGRE